MDDVRVLRGAGSIRSLDVQPVEPVGTTVPCLQQPAPAAVSCNLVLEFPLETLRQMRIMRATRPNAVSFKDLALWALLRSTSGAFINLRLTAIWLRD